jgi:pyruvate/2-oxoglutarate dehydrogenase complex dihydrolipoamide acyltransferase (E2) component
VHARPFIPPLEESFEQAWERAKLTSPPDSPHLSRAAAGSIIAIALAIILGALAYNFRQDIGSIFIQLGQSISGGNRAAAPAAPAPSPETKPDTTPSAEANQTTSRPAPSQSVTSQPQNAPAELGNAGKSSASPADKNLAAGAATTTPGASGTKSGAALPPVVKVPENSAPSVAADAAAKTAMAADSGIGQEEFAAACGFISPRRWSRKKLRPGARFAGGSFKKRQFRSATSTGANCRAGLRIVSPARLLDFCDQF